MSERADDSHQPRAIIRGPVETGYVVFPFDDDQFKEFIQGLLGQPQSISRVVRGPFEIEVTDIHNLSQLLSQRIVQQNAGVLAGFTARITFSDDSTVELNSVAELLSYNEVRPVSCRGLYLEWEYLVRFTDKRVPEKQSIGVTFWGEGLGVVTIDEARVHGPGVPFESAGFITFRIEHTARTWGADLEALLTNYTKSLVKPESKVKAWIRKHSNRISLAIAVGFFAVVSAGLLVNTRRFASRRLAEFLNARSDSTSILAYIGEMFASGLWAQYTFAVVVVLVVSVFVAIFLGIWADSTATTAEPSFILLTKESRKHKEAVLRKQRKKWLGFCASVVLSLVLGVLTNIIFAKFFS